MSFFSFFYLVSFILCFGCDDWFLIWVGLEINMMSFIALVYNRSMLSVELCLKYFFIQSIGSGILMIMFYGEFMWFDYVTLSVLSYKMGAGPFFFWFPSICEMLGWGGCFLLMSVQKLIPLLVMSFLLSTFLWMIIFTSLMIGALGSLNQKNLKRLMAYSSIHHIGWILLGNFVSNFLWIVYLVMYSLLILGIFLSLFKDNVLEVSLLGKMSSKWVFVFGMLSMGGMPPMLGFYLKWWLFYNLMSVDMTFMIFMVMMSVMMFYVYLRVVYSVLMGGMEVESWMFMNMEMYSVSMDTLYMLGLNVGVMVWMVLS